MSANSQIQETREPSWALPVCSSLASQAACSLLRGRDLAELEHGAGRKCRAGCLPGAGHDVSFANFSTGKLALSGNILEEAENEDGAMSWEGLLRVLLWPDLGMSLIPVLLLPLMDSPPTVWQGL